MTEQQADRAGPLSTLVPVAAVLGSITSLCVGSSFAKTLFPVLGAQGATTLRQVCAALLLALVWRPWRKRLGRRQWGAILQYGATLGLMNLCFYQAIARIPVAIAIAIEFTGPLTLSMLSSRRWLDLVWVALAAAGLALLLPLHGMGPLDPTGIAFALAAAVCWALYIITGQRTGAIPGGQATALGMAVAALVVAPFGLVPALVVVNRPTLLGAGLLVGLLSSALPYSLEMLALRRLPRHTFGILLSLEPAVGALAAWAVLGEVLSSVQGIAVGLVMLASAGSAIGARSTPLEVATPGP